MEKEKEGSYPYGYRPYRLQGEPPLDRHEPPYRDRKTIHLMLFGDVGVGKHQLRDRFLFDTFGYEGHVTRVSDIYVKEVDINIVKVDNIWNPLSESFVYDVSFLNRSNKHRGVLIVFDITNEQSFRNVTSHLLVIQESPQYEGTLPKNLILVGNKCDMESKRQVSRTEAEEFAHNCDMLYVETSAKDDINVHLVFNIIITEILQSRRAAEQCNDLRNLATDAEAQLNKASFLLEEAMQSGYVLCNLVILLLIGVAGSGKTSFSQLLLNKPPPALRESTPLAQAAIRAVSISRTAVTDGGTVWKTVSPSELLQMLGDGIKSEVMLHFEMAAPLPSSPAKRVPCPGVVKSFFQKIQKHKPKVERPDNLLTTKSKPSSSKLAKSKPAQKVLSQIRRGDPTSVSKERFRENWVYLIDSGGQPQYHELIPTFIYHVSGAALFVKLNEDLASNPTIAYYAKGGKLCGATYSSPLTHQQTIKNCLQMIQSRLNVTGGNDCPALFFVGTHRDLESESESIETKDEQLLDMLKSLKGLKEHLVFCRVAKPEKLMYAVNAKNPQVQDHHTVGEFRQAVMSGCKKIELKIPLSWFILEQQLQERAQEKGTLVLSLNECLAAAENLEMDKDRVLAALDYFVRLNLFKFFPKVLPNVVFTTSQVLLDKISELVAYSHYLHGGPALQPESTRDESDTNSLRFRDHAIVNATFLWRFDTHYCYADGLFTPQELLDVLSNQLVFAPFIGEDFFMPCVLPQLPLEKVATFRLPSGSAVAPMLIHYPGGLFSTGLFSGLVAFLQDRSPWKVAVKHGEPICLFKNCVVFRHSDFPITLTLMYSFEFIEIHIQVQQGFPDPYTSIRTTLFLGLERAAKIQGCDSLHPQVGFLCPCGKDSTSHLATISDDGRWWFCSLDDTCTGALAEEHIAWLTDYVEGPTSDRPVGSESLRDSVQRSEQSKIPAASTPQRGDKPTLHQLQVVKGRGGQRVRVIDSVAPEWEELAIALRFEPTDIDCVKRDYIQNSKGACREILIRWLNGEGSQDLPLTWDTLIQCLIDAGQVGVAENLQETLLQ